MKIISFILILTSLAYAEQKHLVYIGGGGEPPGKYTMFDRSSENYGKFFTKSGWTYDVAFDGGHKNTEEVISDYFPKTKNTPFNEDSFNAMIQKTSDKIDNELKPGDKLMILVDTHGGETMPSLATHTICGLSDSWDSCSHISLDPIVELAKKAEKKGIKLAIVDMSCHSGGTQNVINHAPSTCVISSTSDHNFSVRGYSETFAYRLKSGRNLEEVFLAARDEHHNADIPQISTPAGKKIRDKLQDVLSEHLYLNDSRVHINQLSDLLKNKKSVNDLIPICEMNNLKLISDWSNEVLNKTKNQNIENKYKKLFSALKNYEDQRTLIEKAILRQNNLSEYEETFNCKGTYIDPSSHVEKSQTFSRLYTSQELASMKFDKQIENIKARAAEKPGSYEALNNLCQLEVTLKAKAQAEKLKNDPQFIENQKLELEMQSALDKTRSLAEEVGYYERDLYDDLYKELSKDEKTNPCRDFVL